jgi:hypothetical protein
MKAKRGAIKYSPLFCTGSRFLLLSLVILRLVALYRNKLLLESDVATSYLVNLK